jgi:hypothetical protein
MYPIFKEKFNYPDFLHIRMSRPPPPPNNPDKWRSAVQYIFTIEYPVGQISYVAISTGIFANKERANFCSSLSKQELVIQTKIPSIRNTFNAR